MGEKWKTSQTNPAKSLKSQIGKLMTTGHFKRIQIWIELCQRSQCMIGKFSTFGHTQLTELQTFFCYSLDGLIGN